MAARRGAKKKAVRKPAAKRPAKAKSRAAAKPVKRAKVKPVKPVKKKPAGRASARPVAKAKPGAKAKPVAKKKSVVAKQPAKRPARRSAPHTSAKPRPAARLVARRPASQRRPATQAAPEFTPAFEPQRQVANPKELLLFDMQRARVTVMAAIQGLTAPTADRPTAPGKWSVREIVLHLIVRDRVRLDEFDSVLGGQPASWIGLDDAAMARVNELHLGPLRPLSWEEAVRLLQATREQLVATLVSVPSHPAELWTEAHPFGAMMLALPRHDRHHAEQIKNARIEG